MAVVTTRQLLESGVHFGHQTRRWNPKMKRFIFTERNGIYIIDLQQSLTYIDRAYAFVKDTVARGGQVLFVGTKKQAQEAIAEQATRVGMPYVNQRWLGGMLTNFDTVIKRIQRLKELEGMDFDDVAASGLTKKELLGLRREKDKLEKTLGGIRDMTRTPQAVWIVDTKKEHLAVDEARKLRIPVIGILDTNCDPDEVDFAIPGNDDAIRSVSLLTRVLADAVAEGLVARSGAPDRRRGRGRADARLGAGAAGCVAGAGRRAEPHDERCRRGRRLRCPARSSPRRRPSWPRRPPTAEADAERQSDDPDPENEYRPGDRARPTADPTKPRTIEDEDDSSTMARSLRADVKKLRDATGAGMMDCKKALTEADGDYDKAVEILRVTGQAKAAKRGAERSATNGLVAFADGALLQLGRRDRLRGQERRVPGAGRRRGQGRRRQPRPTRWRRPTRPRCRRARPWPRRSSSSRSRSARSSRSPPPRTSTARPRSTCTSGPPTCRRRSACWCEYEGDDETAARTAAMQIAAMRPQYLSRGRRPGRPGRERAPDRRGDGQGGGQARAGLAEDRRGPGERLLQGRRPARPALGHRQQDPGRQGARRRRGQGQAVRPVRGRGV